MKVEINLTTDSQCGVSIVDTTQYLSEDSIGSPNIIEYREKDVHHVIIVSKIGTTEYDVYIHKVTSEFKLGTLKDGAYNILFMLIPDIEYHKDPSRVHPEIEYYTDGTKIYKETSPKIVEETLVPIEELIELNKDAAGIVYTELSTSLICHLKKCYINLCRSLSFDKCNNSNENFNRDLVWMSINIIDYLTGFGQLEEVSKIINLIQGCNGICKFRNSESDSDECGCA